MSDYEATPAQHGLAVWPDRSGGDRDRNCSRRCAGRRIQRLLMLTYGISGLLAVIGDLRSRCGSVCV